MLLIYSNTYPDVGTPVSAKSGGYEALVLQHTKLYAAAKISTCAMNISNTLCKLIYVNSIRITVSVPFIGLFHSLRASWLKNKLYLEN